MEKIVATIEVRMRVLQHYSSSTLFTKVQNHHYQFNRNQVCHNQRSKALNTDHLATQAFNSFFQPITLNSKSDRPNNFRHRKTQKRVIDYYYHSRSSDNNARNKRNHGYQSEKIVNGTDRSANKKTLPPHFYFYSKLRQPAV